MLNISIMIEGDKIEQITKDLGQYKARLPIVIRAAVNKTAKQARLRLSREVVKKYQTKIGNKNKKGVKDSMKLRLASINNLSASIETKDKRSDLWSFKVNPDYYVNGNMRPEFWRGQVVKDSGLKNIYIDGRKAFSVIYHNAYSDGRPAPAHLTLAYRNPDPDKYMKSRPTGSPAHREGLQNVYTVGNAQMVGAKRVYNADIKKYLEEQLGHNLDEQVKKTLYMGSKGMF